jgi:nitrite reductase/ring-hydroxylating ferredoxin subunit
MTDTLPQDDCGGCALHDAVQDASRRAFLKKATLAFTGAAVALGMTAERASALPLSLLAPQAGGGDEKKYPFPAADGVQVDKDNGVMIARVGAKVYAFALTCPHQNTAIKWDAGDQRFQCPKHKSRYRADGTFIEGRATRSLDRFGLRRDGNTIAVDLDQLYRQDEQQVQWTGATLST